MSERVARALPQSLQEEIRGIAEASAFDLKKSLPRLEIVERTRIDAAIQELMFQASGSVRDDNFLSVGRMLGADHLLIYEVTANSDEELEALRAVTGDVRAVANGKVIRVETGTVIFQQMIGQSVRLNYDSSLYKPWNLPQLQGWRGQTARSAMSQLFMTLLTAQLPFPTGMVWGPEKDGTGVRVTYVIDLSPSQHAGIREGDLITAIDGNPVRWGDRILYDIEMIPRELAQFTIQRNGQEQTFVVRPPMRNSIEKSPSLSKP